MASGIDFINDNVNPLKKKHRKKVNHFTFFNFLVLIFSLFVFACGGYLFVEEMKIQQKQNDKPIIENTNNHTFLPLSTQNTSTKIFTPSLYDYSEVALIALNEVGNDYLKYAQWFGWGNQRYEWCAVFVCWVANQAGYEKDVDYLFSKGPNTDVGHPYDSGSGAGSHARFANQFGRYFENDGTYVPKSGDFIYFDWGDDNGDDDVMMMDHIGIVINVDGDTVYTVEGNSTGGNNGTDLVRVKSYSLDIPDIKGFSSLA